MRRPASQRTESGKSYAFAVVVMAIPLRFELHGLQQDALSAGSGRVGIELRVHLRALGDGAGGRVVEVLAEVPGVEMGERAEPHADPRDARRAFVRRELLEPVDEVLGQMLLVH